MALVKLFYFKHFNSFFFFFVFLSSFEKIGDDCLVYKKVAVVAKKSVDSFSFSLKSLTRASAFYTLKDVPRRKRSILPGESQTEKRGTKRSTVAATARQSLQTQHTDRLLFSPRSRISFD